MDAPFLNETCQRCGGPFHCGVADPLGCACFDLKLSPTLMGQLRQNFQRCLCIACLKALQNGAELRLAPGPAASP